MKDIETLRSKMSRVLLICFGIITLAFMVPVPSAAADTLDFNTECLEHLSQLLSDPKRKAQQDIDPSLFQNFWKSWALITTRYKPEGRELRFVYANKVAAEALGTGKYPLPEGAMLAKIAAEVAHDPLFDTSLIPGKITRVQIMQKKPGDPKAIDGWVYALYTNLQVPVQQVHDLRLTKDDIESCGACHAMAAPRDMVFSQPFPVAGGAASPRVDVSVFRNKFVDTPISKLSPKDRRFLLDAAPDMQVVRAYAMPLFEGSIFEAREVLADFSRVAGKAYILTSPNAENTIAAVPSGKCVSVISTTPGEDGKTPIYDRREICDPM